MNFKGINTKVSIIFFLSLILLVTVFFASLEYSKKQFHLSLNETYEKIINNIHKSRMSPMEIETFVKPFGLFKENKHHEIKRDMQQIGSGRGFSVFTHKDSIYLHLHTPHFRIMFKDSNPYRVNYLLYIVFSIVLLLFVFIYYLIIKNINDTKLLMQSRQLFLRTVMHELKTPIAKGRIVSELIDDEKQKNRVITLFKELNFLIDEMAKVEQVMSKNYNLNKYSYNIKELLQNAIDKLMLEDTSSIIVENISPRKIEADLELLSMAMKNLIDNALKYSSDKKVVVQEIDSEILFISQGDKLPKPLEEYFKPFHNDTSSKTHGMGLGLYIVHNILVMHNMNLKYEYKENKNIFKIV